MCVTRDAPKARSPGSASKGLVAGLDQTESLPFLMFAEFLLFQSSASPQSAGGLCWLVVANEDFSLCHGEPLPGRRVLEGLQPEVSSVDLSLAWLHLQLKSGLVRPETWVFGVLDLYTKAHKLSLRAWGVMEGS